jgi:hypothetical protein
LISCVDCCVENLFKDFPIFFLKSHYTPRVIAIRFKTLDSAPGWWRRLYTPAQKVPPPLKTYSMAQVYFPFAWRTSQQSTWHLYRLAWTYYDMVWMRI